jgi:hypothetical protein
VQAPIPQISEPKSQEKHIIEALKRVARRFLTENRCTKIMGKWERWTREPAPGPIAILIRE